MKTPATSPEILKAEETARKKSAAAIKGLKTVKHVPANLTPDQLIREKSRLVQTRAHTYETNIHAVQQLYPDKEVIANALIFLKKSKPSPDQYRSLTDSILKDRTDKAKHIRGMNKSQKQIVIENITWKYLDSVCFNGKDLDAILTLKDHFNRLQDHGLDMKAIYKGWDSVKAADFEPEVDYKKIKKVLTS
jgi:hypothetical protein